MSRRGAAKAPTRARAAQPSKTTGARAFNRRAHAAGRLAARRRVAGSSRPSASRRAWEALCRAPRAAWICALVACLNAACWSIVTPPFQVPDEPSHFAYTQQLVENARLPTSSEELFSPEETVVLRDLHFAEVHWNPGEHTIFTAAEQRQLQGDLARNLARSGAGGVGGAYNAPPLYYLLEAVPYELASGGTLLDQLELMRLLSALMAGLTALFVYLFVRETLPASRWAWTVGGLSVALAPLLGFMSGAMNPDALLFAVSAAVFYCLARAFRRGLTDRLAIAIGSLTAIGLLTKLNFIGIAPGVMLGMILLSVRRSRSVGRVAYRSLGFAMAIAVSPVCVYVLANLLSGRAGLGIVSTTLGAAGSHGPILHEIAYTWELFLPRLPGMTDYFPGLSTIHQLWFDRSVGFYGWLDTSFPLWVDNIALVPATLIAVLCARALVRDRGALRRRAGELVIYAVMCTGLLVLIGASSYANAESEGLGFSEPRYLLPLLPLFAVVLALGARGAGRRWGPAVGAVIVVLFLTHDILSQLLVVSRFYG